MQSLHDFIIELPKPLNETFKTESGTEIYAHKDFSVDRLSNRIAKVVGTPIYYDSPIKEGYEVMFEPTILYKQIYKGVTQDYTHYVDKSQKLFRITPNMIVLYRKDEDECWKGFADNLLVAPIEETETVVTSSVLIIPETAKVAKHKKDKVLVVYANKNVEELGVNDGDEVYKNPTIDGVKFWIDGKEFRWIRTKDVWAKAS